MTFGKMLLSTLMIFSGALAHAEAAAPVKVRWLIAHEPIDAFRRAAKTFAERLAKESNGNMTLEVLTPKDVGSKTGNMNAKDIFRLLNEGKVELSQTVTTGIGTIEPKFFVLDLPFLFKDHEHASKVLDGKIGQNLLASLEKSHVRGLAFTYSGGFRVVPTTNRAIDTTESFKGMRVRTSNSPVAQETLRLLGAKPVPMFIDGAKEALEENKVDGAETTYVRIDSVAGPNTKFINNTQHSLFLTSILASSKFFNSLSPANQAALERAAMAAAKVEREDSIADGEKLKNEYIKKGVKVIDLPAAEMAKMEKQLQPVYKKFGPQFGTMVEDIVAAQK